MKKTHEDMAEFLYREALSKSLIKTEKATDDDKGKDEKTH